ncbi:MAG: AarF/UbiB family protein [Bacteroidota bacterium]
MRFPSPSDYQEAVQLPDLAFQDPVLAQGAVETNALGLPRARTGAFAVVFRVETAMGPRAVRCFLQAGDDLKRRYKAVQAALKGVGLTYFVDFEWQTKGLHVGDQVVPILVMEWADGVPIDQFIEAHRVDTERLTLLFHAWCRLLADLADANLSHGDLQHGNVLVQDDGQEGLHLKLVDYDAVQVPGLRERTTDEVGHRHYQHPDRSELDAGPHLDRFPGLVIATSVAALANDPGLWDRYATGENLIFRSEDFFDPEASSLFANLREDNDARVRRLAEALYAACYLPVQATPTLAAVLSGEAMGPVPRQRRPVRRERRRTSSLERIAQVALLAALAASVWGLWQPLAFAVAVMLLLVGAVVGWASWHRHPDVRRRSRLGRERRVLDRWIADLDAESQRMRMRLGATYADRDAQRRERLVALQRDVLHRQLRQHFVSELDHLEGVGHRAVVRLKAAGIRDAAMATPEAVRAVARVSAPTKARIAQWRSALARQYAPIVPEALSPAEEQRLRRRVERARTEAEAEIRRIEAKAEAQRLERDAIDARLVAVPPRTFLHHLLACLT